MELGNVKKITISAGEVKQIEINGVVVWKGGYTNLIPTSINSDGSIYNNGLGYKDGYRIRSGGLEATSSNTTCSGFIKVSAGDVVRIKWEPWFDGTGAQNALNAADASFNNIGQFTMGQNAQYGIFLEAAYKPYTASSIVEEKEGVWKWVVPPAASGIAYIRITAFDINNIKKGKDLIITINEEIE